MCRTKTYSHSDWLFGHILETKTLSTVTSSSEYALFTNSKYCTASTIFWLLYILVVFILLSPRLIWSFWGRGGCSCNIIILYMFTEGVFQQSFLVLLVFVDIIIENGNHNMQNDIIQVDISRIILSRGKNYICIDFRVRSVRRSHWVVIADGRLNAHK